MLFGCSNPMRLTHASQSCRVAARESPRQEPPRRWPLLAASEQFRRALRSAKAVLRSAEDTFAQADLVIFLFGSCFLGLAAV